MSTGYCSTINVKFDIKTAKHPFRSNAPTSSRTFGSLLEKYGIFHRFAILEAFAFFVCTL